MEPEIAGSPEQKSLRSPESISQILKNIQVCAIYLAAFLAPIFYLPFSIDPLFGKQVLVMILIATAFLAWLIRILITKEINYHYSVVLIALGVMLGVLLFASAFSLSPRQSFFAPDLSGERFVSFAAFAVIAFLIAAEFSRKHLERLVGILLASGLILAPLIFFNVAAFLPLPETLQINPVGFLNNSAAVMLAFFLLAFGFVIFSDVKSRYFKIAAWLLTIAAAINLLLIDFKMGWLALAAFSVLLIAIYSSRFFRPASAAAEPTTFINLLFVIILGASISLAIFSLPIERVLPNLRAEIEVMPSLGSTLAIGLEVLKTKPALGTGPGTFVYDYDRFHGPAVNQTVFWNAKFVQGFSFLTTIVSTLGTLGILAFLFLIASLFYALVRIASRLDRFGPFEFGTICVVILGVVLWLIYTPTFVMNFLIFLMLGGFLAIAADFSDPTSVFLRFERRTFKIENQVSAFATSLSILAIVILLFLSVFYCVKKYVAEIYFTRGNFEFIRNGNADTALVRYASALSLDPRDDRYLINQSQVYLARAQAALNRAAAGEADTRADFQANLNAAIESARQAAAADPYDAEAWLNLGSIYEIAMPFVNGADRFAIASYEEARRYKPTNPIPHTLLGRTYIEIVDIIDASVKQDPSLAKNAEELKKSALDNARQHLEKAVELKSDYASAEFLLAQTFTREGNVDEAIRHGIQTALAAPQDVGVAFFLGFLFYQKDDLVVAEQQFSRAIQINPNYSNAMYFLGLIYDRTERRGEALKIFRRIFELNPDNEEVRKIIVNLEAGRPALSTITPPPEKRKEPPLKETQPKPQSTRRRR